MAKRRNAPKKSVEEIDDERPSRRKRRFLRRLVVVCLLLVALIGVAPWGIANSPLRDMLLNWQMPVGGWRIQCRQAGLSWSGSQSLTDVAILDPAGNPLTTVELLSLERSLLGLATNSRELGTLRIVKPTVYLATRADGSNVEDFLKALERQQAASETAGITSKASGVAKSINVEVVDGILRGLDTLTGQQWNVEKINLTASRNGAQLTADGAATIQNVQTEPAGRVKFRAIPTENGGQQFDLLAEALLLEPLTPWLARFIGDCQLTGTTSLDAHIKRELTADNSPAFYTWGRLESNGLNLSGARFRGDELRLDQLVIPWKFGFDGENLAIEDLNLESDWLSLKAHGTLRLPNFSTFTAADLRQPECSCEGKVALAKLAAMLPNTLQIHEGVRLETGNLSFDATAEKDADDYRWSAAVRVEDISGERAGKKLAWKEPLAVSAAWVDSDTGPRLDRFYLEAPFAKAEFETEAKQITGDFDCDLSVLTDQLSQFVDLGFTGQGEAKGKLSFSAIKDYIEVTGIEGRINNLRFDSGAVALDEPFVEFSGDCLWNIAERKLASRAFQLASSVVAFRSRDLRLEFSPGRVPVMTGDVAVRTDLERLSRAVGLTGIWPRGSASSVMRFATNSEQVLADFNFDAENLQLVKQANAASPVVVWSEPKLHSAGKAVYAIPTQRASIDNLRIDGQTMRLAGAAAWDKPLSGGSVVVNGNLQYNPSTLAGLIANYVGPSVQIEGDGIVKFEARGILPSKPEVHWSRSWQANAEAGWTKAAAFGLPISASKLQGTLADGQLRTVPLDVSIGEGRLTSNPLAIFDPEPLRIIVPAGPLITNVQISPAVSEQMLKYVAPILAGATRVDGQFSLNLAETQLPLTDPKQTRTAGTLAVHQLTVLPGPLLVDIVNLIQRVQSLKNPQDLLTKVVASKPAKLLSMNDQQIEFKVESGRVYHRKLEFVIDDVPISSTGSVGFDQTLALVIEIPIQDRWIDGEPALSGLAGQSLQIPIQGSFQKPRVDERAIADITRQLLRNTAGQAIGNEINRQLEKLFQGK